MGNSIGVITPYTVSVHPIPTPSKESSCTHSKEYTDLLEKRQLEDLSTSSSITMSNDAISGRKRLFPPSYVMKSWV